MLKKLLIVLLVLVMLSVTALPALAAYPYYENVGAYCYKAVLGEKGYTFSFLSNCKVTVINLTDDTTGKGATDSSGYWGRDIPYYNAFTIGVFPPTALANGYWQCWRCSENGFTGMVGVTQIYIEVVYEWIVL